MLSFKDKKKINEIVNLLKMPQRGAIVLIACYGKKIQCLVEKEIKEAFKDKTIFHTIKLNEKRWNIPESLQNAGPESVYLIYNLPDIISSQLSSNNGQMPESLQVLNLNREIFTERLIKGIFWLDEKTLSDYIPFMSPDFWSYRTLTASFKDSEDEIKTIKDKVSKSKFKKEDEVILEKEALLRKYLDKRPDDIASIINIRHELAESLSIAGRNIEAIQHFKEILKESKKVNDYHNESSSLNNIGIIYKIMGKDDEALKYYNEALLIDREIGHKQGEASALTNIGIIYKSMGRPDEALKYISNALQYWRQIDNIKEEAKYLKIMGDIYLSKEKIEDAVYLYKDAIDIYEELKDNDEVRELKEKVNSLIPEESIA